MEKTWPIVKEQDHGFREKTKRENIKKNNIYGVEIEEDFFVEADPDIFTMIHERTI